MHKTLLQRRQLLLYFGLGVMGAGVTAAALQSSRRSDTSIFLSSHSSNASAANPLAALPEFQGISQWLNSAPLTAVDLKGSVVLVQFWTFACINCQRTLPYVVRWHQQYAAQGLKVIGIHTPEFAFERDAVHVKNALRQHQISYPVPLDNGYKTWTAYGSKYWPHLFLADRQGFLDYDHVGEGAYQEIEQTIRKLLG